MKKLLTIILILAVLGTLTYCMRYRIIGMLLNDSEDLRIGKSLFLTVEQGEVVDYSNVLRYDLWNESARKKLADYMKSNNLRIKEGSYKFNQTTTFERALEIFEFEKIEKIE